MKFRAKSEHALEHLSDDDLVANLVAARDAGADDQVKTATGLLVWRRRDTLLALVLTKVSDLQDAEDIVQVVLEQAIKASFRGEHAGEFFALVHTIRKRRVADYFAQKAADPKFVSTVGNGGESVLDGISDGSDFAAESDMLAIVEGVLSELSDRDRMVCEMRLDGTSSREVAAAVGGSGMDRSERMTPVNVDQIFARFKKRLREVLESGGGI